MALAGWVSLLAFFLWVHAVSEHGPLITSLPAAAWGFFAMVLGVLAPLIVPATKEQGWTHRAAIPLQS